MRPISKQLADDGVCINDRLAQSVQDRLPAVIGGTIVGGLVLDRFGGSLGLLAVNVWVWLLFAVLVWVAPRTERQTLLLCLVFAAAGEVFCSLVWGLYEYRRGGIPLFVPPGHVLLFWLGLHLSRFADERWLKLAIGACSVGVVALAVSGHDWLSVPLLIVFFACWRFGPAPRLYATMFVLALLMEVIGTALGNWSWQAQVPLLAWSTMNPPLAAGACYCVLDVLVQVCTRRSVRLRAAV